MQSRSARHHGGRGAFALWLALVLAVVPSSVAQEISRDELSKARETFFKEERTGVRLRAARTMIASGKKVHRDAVVDAMFETYESPRFCEDLLELVRAFLVDEDGAPDRKVARRVRDLADSSNDDKQLHGFRLAAWLGVGGIEDELDDVLDDALEVLEKAEEGAPKRDEVLDDARRAAAAAVAAYVGGAPRAPELLAWLDRLRVRDDATVRRAAYEAYVELGVSEHVDALSDGAGDPDRAIGALCVDALVDWAEEPAVPALFAQLADDRSLDARLLPALFRLTGERIRSRARWESWWRQRPDDFAILDEETYDALVEQLAAARTASQYGPLGSFFGYSPKADSVVFVIDVSGSMDGVHSSVGSDDVFLPAGPARRSRLDVVKEQVGHAIAGLGGKHFDIVLFRDTVMQWSPGGSTSFPTYQQALTSAHSFLDGLEARGGTALHAGLQLAFSLPLGSEIVLLSDGDPSVGERTPSTILADVRRWNARRDTPADLHCIGLGYGSQLLDDLGALTDDSSSRTIE